MVQARCPTCGAQIQVDEDLETAICPYCGNAYIVERAIQNYTKMTINKTENHYGNENNVTAQTVINHYYYGTHPVEASKSKAYSEKSKLTALLLCIFLGWLGLHRFYLERYKTGLVWLFSFGLFYIGWIADIFGIVSGSLKDSKGQTLRPFNEAVP